MAALQYIYERNPSAALRLRQRAEKILRRLEQHPYSGRVIPEFADLPYREVIVPPYRFFYRVSEKNVWIVAVWHSARIPSEPEQSEGG
jgi:toxin ParE1/3/4